MRFPWKTPISLVVHGRGKHWSRSWQELITAMSSSVHGREEPKRTALYSYFPYRKKQVYKELKRTLALSYDSLHRRPQTKRRVTLTKKETPSLVCQRESLLNIYTAKAVYLYSCQLLIWISLSFSSQNASMKALAKRALVINGMLWSIAPRRIR